MPVLERVMAPSTSVLVVAVTSIAVVVPVMPPVMVVMPEDDTVRADSSFVPPIAPVNVTLPAPAATVRDSVVPPTVPLVVPVTTMLLSLVVMVDV